MSDKYELKLFEAAHSTITNATQNRTEPLATLAELPSTVGWAYVMTHLGKNLLQSEKQRLAARGRLVLEIAAQKMQEAFDGNVHDLLFVYAEIPPLQVAAGDVVGAQRTAQVIAPHLEAAAQAPENAIYHRNIEAVTASTAEVLQLTP